MADTPLTTDDSSTSTPFWNMNIPPSQHTAECPDYLAYARKDARDREILATRDEDYHWQTWAEVQKAVRDNRIDTFTRSPSDLRMYRQYCAKLAAEHGSIMNFVMQERLRWQSLEAPAGEEPFSNPDSYKILYNDWPYGIDPRIVHLVVWTKFDLPSDPDSDIGDMAAQTREMLRRYVDDTFVNECGRENVAWFRNWTALKSVHAVEHFHVMLFDPPSEFVRRITGGDEAMAAKVKKEKQRNE